MIVRFVNQQSKHAVTPWRSLLQQVLSAAIAATPSGMQFQQSTLETTVTVLFAGPRVMRRINRQSRQVDALTDVLSFPLLDAVDGHLTSLLGAQDYDPDVYGQKAVMLGDIVISLDKAFEQAADYGHSPEREVAFLAVHGLLHLIGYDHDETAREQLMLKKQQEILGHLGLVRGEKL